MRSIFKAAGLGFALLALFLSGCRNDAPAEGPREIVPVPRFNQDSAYALIRNQIAFGPRVPNTESHRKCRNWIVGRLKSFGADVIEQNFDARVYTGEEFSGTNIIGRYNKKNQERIFLAAHWDTRHIADKDTIKREEPIPGADDGASGVAVLLEIARQLHQNPVPLGIDLIFFDLEDYGAEEPGQTYTWGLGSQYWSKNLHDKNYKAKAKYGILLDMVGAKDARFTKEGYSRKAAPGLVEKIWDLAGRMKRDRYFVPVNSSSITDDHFFVIENSGIPMIDIINRPDGESFGRYHHTHADDISIIDKATLDAIGQVVLAVVYNESNGNF